jgi:hypothetical protein
VLLGLGGCTAAACAAAPEIGWTGWIGIAVVWFGLKHLENQRQIRIQLEELSERDHDRYPSPDYDLLDAASDYLERKNRRP